MPLAPTLSMLALLMPLQGAFQESHKEMVTVVEGQNLDLHCTVAAATTGQNKPTLEWKNPKGFVIFFNNYRGLKDRRYKLTHYSMDSLSISLFNVTTQDEGLYTCYHYSETIQRKQVNVLAAPSQPHLETLRIRNHNKEEKIILKCSTWGSKPPPQITWLLDNGMELFGDTEHQLDGKKYNSTSILTVHTYTQRSSLTCIVRHKILKGGHLTATLHLELFKSTTALTPNSSEFSTVTLENPLAYTALDKILTVAGGNPRTPTLFPSTETSIMNFNSTTNGSDKILNVTQGKFPIWTQSTSTDAAMANSQTTDGTNLTHQGIKKNEPRVLLPVLVTALLAVLSIIVFLFVIKLWKAHREWKKENDVSEQTLESNRSKPNEDNHGLVKNGHVVPWKMSKKYVIRGSCTRMSKNSEGSQDSSVFEKHVPYIIRQTDLMAANLPSSKGLIQPHVHYSFLQTASEGLSQNESDSESLAEEIEYQLELQKRISKMEKMVDQSGGELEEDSLEEDSLEEDSLEEKGLEVQEGESDVDEPQIPNGSTNGKENCSDASQEEGVDRYSELRYNPNWKKNQERSSFADLKDSHQEDEDSSPVFFLDSARVPAQLRFKHENNQPQKRPQNRSPSFDRESSNSCDLATSARKGSYRQSNKEEVVVHHYNGSPSIHSDSFSSHIKECKHRPEKDFVEKNKLTLGLASQPSNSYLQRHGKKQRGNSQGQAHLSKKPGMRRTNSSQAGSPEEKRSPVQHPLGDQVELRGQQGGRHNALEFENAYTDSNSYREVPDLEPDSRPLLHQSVYPNPSVALLSASTANNSSWNSDFPRDPASNVHQKGKPHSMNLTIARNPLQPNSYQNFPERYPPCTDEKKGGNLHSSENTSGSCYQHPPHRCTVSEPHSLARHGKHQNFLGHRSFSPRYHAGLQQPVNKRVSALDPTQICTEKIPSSYVSGNSGPPQPAARILIKGPSPTAQLIQVAEQHHQEISQLADAHLTGSQFASMFPHIMPRGESDSRLNMESCEESQPVLSRSNSEGFLLQMEKQKKRKGKNRKASRTKGYMKMDVKLGGLGADYETIKEKTEKIKQQKEYAKQVKEHNLRNITSARKPVAKPENKSSVSRQKALEYAKTVPKPKLFVSRPSEPEPKDERILAHTLNGENLPPILPVESLQNRHEKEKQAVAAFKALHIV